MLLTAETPTEAKDLLKRIQNKDVPVDAIQEKINSLEMDGRLKEYFIENISDLFDFLFTNYEDMKHCLIETVPESVFKVLSFLDNSESFRKLRDHALKGRYIASSGNIYDWGSLPSSMKISVVDESNCNDYGTNPEVIPMIKIGQTRISSFVLRIITSFKQDYKHSYLSFRCKLVFDDQIRRAIRGACVLDAVVSQPRLVKREDGSSDDASDTRIDVMYCDQENLFEILNP